MADRNSPQKHVWRARIVLLTADGHGTAEIMRRAGREQGRRSGAGRSGSWTAGVDGLLRDKTRPLAASRRWAPRSRPAWSTLTTTGDPPGETTHWTAAAMAAAVGISASSVQRIWRAHGLQPHRVRTLQALQRPALRRQAARHRRAVRRPAGPRHRAVGRREVPCVDGPRLARGWLSIFAAGCLQSCVRPRSRPTRTAGPDGFRGSGPQQILGLETLDFSRLPPIRRCNRPRHRSPSLASFRLAALTYAAAAAW